MATGVIVSEEFKKHDPGEGHPESPARMDAVARAIAAPELEGKLTRIAPRPAEKEQILLVHWEHLYDEVMATRGRERTYLDSDTVASVDSAAVAHLAVGSVLTAVEQVMEGKLETAFALQRPPGHHAKPDKAMGFCLFNNIAVGARYALQRYQLERVLIVDFDVHHGNGTQKAFYTSPEVLYVSTHQSPHYPGTGALSETGKDAGDGFTLNIPMSAGQGDGDYLRVFREVVLPVAREYGPELVMISAGFDAHRDDPLGAMEMTRDGFAALTAEMLELARASCGGKVVLALEGGYHLVALERSIVSVLSVLAGAAAPEVPVSKGAGGEALEEVRKVHGVYWSSLRG